MAVPSAITDLTVDESTNFPPDTETVTATTRPSDYLRAHASILRRPWAKGADVASATAANLGSNTDGDYFHITGTTGIAASNFGTVDAGVERTIVFDGALLLTHNGTSFILPGAANITTAAGDVAVFRSEGSGNWRCVSYVKSTGSPIAFKDEDDMASDSATAAPSQQSTKAYVDGRFVASSVVNAATTHPAEFTGIPSWVKRVTIALNGVSTNTVGTLSIQLGVAAGYVTSGYTGYSGTNLTSGGGFFLYGTATVSTKTGIVTLVLSDSSNDTWILGGIHHEGDTSYISTGTVVLSDTLTKLKVYTASGATDAGSVSITYE